METIIKRIDVDASVAHLRELGDKEKLAAGKRVGSTQYMLEWAVSKKLAALLLQLADELENSKGVESDQPYVEDKDGNRTRKLSPEEFYEWGVKDAQRVVFDHAFRALSRSTSPSANLDEDASATASAMFLVAVGAAPEGANRSFRHAVVWTETINEEES